VRDERNGDVGRELRSELGGDDSEGDQVQATLERLRQLRSRIDEGRLDADDRALLLAILEEEIRERT